MRNFRNFIYCEERKFVFAYVPKVACTNWKSIMRYIAGHEDWLDSRLAHDRINGGLRYLDFEDPADREIIHDTAIPKYAFVRNPYSRTLSAYLNKISRYLPLGAEKENEPHFHQVVRAIDRFRQRNLAKWHLPEVDFEVFLRWLQTSTHPWRYDEHWESQSRLLRTGEVRFDFIGRFEKLQEDAPELLARMGCDITFPTQQDVKFAPTGAADKISRYFTPICTDLVNQLFAEDFENFGYAMAPAGEMPEIV